MEQKEAFEKAHTKLRSKFYRLLKSYRRDENGIRIKFPSFAMYCSTIRLIKSVLMYDASAEIRVKHMKPVTCPFQKTPPPTKEEIEIMESCPKADIENLEELLEEENLSLYIPSMEDGVEVLLRTDKEYFEETEPPYRLREDEEGNVYSRYVENDQEGQYWLCKSRVSVLILKLKESEKQRKRPAVVFLHSLNKDKESLRPLLKAYASRGYIAISMDTAHHGERALCTDAFRDALIFSWHVAKTLPLYETVWDLMVLADYLTKREDIDPSRIGITGIALGGMYAWFGAFFDTRYAVVVPVIGVQGFRWVADNGKWNDQNDAFKFLFDVARHNLGKDVIDKLTVEKALNRIAPGLLYHFDSPRTIPAIAPRPLLIINGSEDPCCPVASLEVTRSKATEAYEAFQCLDHFKVIVEPGVGHQLTTFQLKEAADWFDKFLNP
ncbi:hypothetical protein VNO80_18287 [Phaseolus coccineus]|uniref:Peptidase S9 prolyl oligopeptidase catalytic domain-containing protein n=1 Tax=Phaseolus coccineus TaxID=3886 RepID=A0AAN9MEB9_PHACN